MKSSVLKVYKFEKYEYSEGDSKNVLAMKLVSVLLYFMIVLRIQTISQLQPLTWTVRKPSNKDAVWRRKRLVKAKDRRNIKLGNYSSI